MTDTSPTDPAAWRRAERARLIGARQAIPVAARKAADLRLGEELDSLLGDRITGQCISLYWPFRGEPDLRDWAARCRQAGARIALPVVRRKAAPLEFRLWAANSKLEKGVWNIPIPPESAELVCPDIVLAPVVGLDTALYRLGYGGGFFDRTIATLRAKGHDPLVIGIGYAQQRIPTITPHRHDIPMMEAILAETSVS